MNPCPCGFLGDPRRECRCPPPQVARYRDRLSGPLRDRLDLTVDVPAVPPELLGGSDASEASATIRDRVVAARALQADRYAGQPVRSNSALTPALMAAHCTLDRSGRRVLDTAVRRLALSARAYDRIRKVARTIADLDGADVVSADHVAEALQFRMLS